jgi:hypothetical protein
MVMLSTWKKHCKLSHQSETLALFTLPNERGVSGVVGTELANQFSDCAHAFFIGRDEKIDNEMTFQVSIRAPKNNSVCADLIANEFGGRGMKGLQVFITSSNALSTIYLLNV